MPSINYLKKYIEECSFQQDNAACGRVYKIIRWFNENNIFTMVANKQSRYIACGNIRRKK